MSDMFDTADISHLFIAGYWLEFSEPPLSIKTNAVLQSIVLHLKQL